MIALRELTAGDLPVVEPWFEDAETRHWLGGPGWALEGLRLAGPNRYNLLAYVDGLPAALVDVEIGEDKRAAFAIVMAPALRGRRIGRTVVGVCMADARFADVSEWFAGVETGNVASSQLLLSCGFAKMTDIDADGFSYYAWRRFGWPELPWRTPWSPPADRARSGPAMSKLGSRTPA